MEGHVRKRGDKWYYSFEASSIEGKRKRIERVGGRTKKDAESALRKALEEYENAGLHFDPVQISVSDYMDYWIKNYASLNCKYNTYTGYEAITKNHIKPILGGYKLRSLTPAILQEFINTKFINGCSKNHLINISCVLSGALKYAVHPCGFLKDSPMSYVRYPKYDETKAEINHKVIPTESFDSIVERFPSNTTFHIALMIGYYTGCRIGEVMGLTWDDINLNTGKISINKIITKRQPYWYFGTPKTHSSVRTVQIGQTLIDALKVQKNWQNKNKAEYQTHYVNQYEIVEFDSEQRPLRRIISVPTSIDMGVAKPLSMVCTKENGEVVTPDSFKYAARVIHYELGISFNFHSLRHTHATTLIENGANIKDVQDRLGHSKIETTLDTYTHDTEKMKKQSVDIFESAVKCILPTKK